MASMSECICGAKRWPQQSSQLQKQPCKRAKIATIYNSDKGNGGFRHQTIISLFLQLYRTRALKADRALTIKPSQIHFLSVKKPVS